MRRTSFHSDLYHLIPFKESVYSFLLKSQVASIARMFRARDGHVTSQKKDTTHAQSTTDSSERYDQVVQSPGKWYEDVVQCWCIYKQEELPVMNISSHTRTHTYIYTQAHTNRSHAYLSSFPIHNAFERKHLAPSGSQPFWTQSRRTFRRSDLP